MIPTKVYMSKIYGITIFQLIAIELYKLRPRASGYRGHQKVMKIGPGIKRATNVTMVKAIAVCYTTAARSKVCG